MPHPVASSVLDIPLNRRGSGEQGLGTGGAFLQGTAESQEAPLRWAQCAPKATHVVCYTADSPVSRYMSLFIITTLSKRVYKE